MSISWPGNFFHRTFSFFSKRVWKLLFLAYFSIFEKKIQKIVKIAKFQMNLDHPIFNIFWHLKRRWKAERPYFTNSEKNVFFKRLQKIFLKKKIKFFAATKKSIFLKNQLFPKKAPKSCFFNFYSKKWIFWIILRILCPRNFFHSTFSFFSNGTSKFGFFMILDIFYKNLATLANYFFEC